MWKKSERVLLSSLSSYRRLARYSALGYRRALTGHTSATVNDSTSSSPWLWIINGIAIAAIFDSQSQGNGVALCESREKSSGVVFSTEQVVTNWSGTHTCQPLRIYEPHSAQEVLRLLQYLHSSNQHARPIGTALSPNGIGMSFGQQGSLISTSALDYVEVDPVQKVVTVGAGARVSEVLKALEVHNLTLQNFSSIQEQQMAGWTQVAAHGTGCSLPTVDDMILRMKLATATEGLLTLSNTSNPKLFGMAKVGLGVLGVVTELTLQCVDRHELLEHSFAVSLKDIAKQHYDRLSNYRHVRYMWLPYTSEVMVVVSNPVDGKQSDPAKDVVNAFQQQRAASTASTDKATKSLYELLIKLQRLTTKLTKEQEEELKALTFSQLRDRLLDFGPLNLAHIQAVNQAEAQFWKASTGSRQADSRDILGFDCGGEQHVFEVCFPIGSLKDKSNKDIAFVEKLMQLIEKHKIPAHCPIEQRWTARSSSKMSPAFSENPEEIFSWVGVIMYLPPNQSTEQRAEITKEFQRYTQLMQPLLDEYQAHCHWAKIELPMKTDSTAVAVKSADNSWWSRFFGSPSPPLDDKTIIANMRTRIRKKYPVDEFNAYRKALDPNAVLSNNLVETLFNAEK